MTDPKKPKEKDALSGVETTGHEWDGLKELNNPAPRWWLWVFIICCVWSVWYWVVYPAWPTLSGNTTGTSGYTTAKELADKQGELTKIRSKYADRVHNATTDQIRHDKELFEYAREAGLAAFKQNCVACHGSGAQGSKGFPNLNDDDWLWGGKLADIEQTIRYGIRSGNDKGRQSQMPAFGKDGILKKEEVEDVATFVGALHDDKAEKTETYNRGSALFTANCAACHGDKGQGGREFGAPRLADNIWLYGGDHATIVETVTNARAGVMPAWEGRLDDDTIKVLSVYVHSLGGGEQ